MSGTLTFLFCFPRETIENIREKEYVCFLTWTIFIITPTLLGKNNEHKTNTILNELSELVNAESERNEKGTEQYKYKQKITQSHKETNTYT